MSDGQPPYPDQPADGQQPTGDPQQPYYQPPPQQPPASYPQQPEQPYQPQPPQQPPYQQQPPAYQEPPQQQPGYQQQPQYQQEPAYYQQPPAYPPPQKSPWPMALGVGLLTLLLGAVGGWFLGNALSDDDGAAAAADQASAEAPATVPAATTAPATTPPPPTTSPPEPTSAFASQPLADIASCRLDLGEGPDPAFTVGSRLPAVGQVDVAVLFADYTDVPGDRTPEEAFASMSPGIAEFLATVSYGQMQMVLHPYPQWVRLGASPDYAVAVTTFEGHRDYIAEAVALADPAFDFSEMEAVAVIGAPSATAIGSSYAWYGYDGDGGRLLADGVGITNAVTTGADLDFWGWKLFSHELGHSMGLPDLYSDVGDAGFTRPFSVMDLISGAGPEYFAFERWHVGWLDDSQILCLGGDHEALLAPIEVAGGAKAMMVPLSSQRAVMVESRRALGYDSELDHEGALVYVVDTSAERFQGPIRVENDRRLLQPGESVTVEGVTVTVAASGPDGDTVQVVASPDPSAQAAPGQAEVLDYLVEIALGAEFGGTDQLVHKWVTNVHIKVNGPATPDDLDALRATVDDLNRLIDPIELVFDDADPNLEFHFAPLDQLGTILPEYVEGNWGYFQSWWDGAGVNIERGVVLIATDVTSPVERAHLIREELTQVLGLQRDSLRYPDSIFQGDWTFTTAFTPLDEAIISLLYDDRITSLMSEADVRAALASN